MNQNNRTERIQNSLFKAQNGHLTTEGDTLYTFENHRAHDFKLPRKSYDGKDFIRPKGRFIGDAYFLMLVRSGDLRVIDSTPVNQPAPVVKETLNEFVGENVEKLILDQPEKFTAKGHSEATVVTQSNACCKGTQTCTSKNESDATADGVLLTENPLDGIDIVNG
jgi:hypothetical protein